MLKSLAPARRRLVLIVLAVVVLALVAAVTAVIVASSGGGDPQSTTPVPQDRPGPVVVVPGYGGSTNGPDEIAAALRTQGKDVTVLKLAGDGTGDLDAQAKQLETVAKAAIARTGAASVDVVGYSAGGVVARLFVKDHGGQGLVRRVVTLGSPHHGTEIAEIGGQVLPNSCPEACQQLRPGSDLLADLNSGDETPAGPQYVSIWTTSDDVVLPPDSARLDGALDLTVQQFCATDTVNHTNLPRDAVAQQIVEAVLGVGAAGDPDEPQLRTSFVVKFAQATPRNTST